MFRLIHLFLLLLTISFMACTSLKEGADTKSSDTNDVLPGIIAPPEEISFPALGSDSGEIPGLKTVTFGYDQSSLSTEARRVLAENATWIQDNTQVLIQVEGHCDSRGSIEYNLSLGERRAKSVKDYLVSLGVDIHRLSTISYGKEKPLDSSPTEEAFAMNRRANFVPLP